MSFRRTIFWGMATALVLMALFEAGLDYAATRSQARLQVETQKRLELYMDAVIAALELAAGMLVLAPSERIEAPDGREGRFRVKLEDQVLFGHDASFPTSEAGWAIAERQLASRYRLEVALRRTPLERLVTNKLLVDLIDLPLFFALAFGVAWLLTRRITRPLRALTRASEQLSRQRFPERIAVPAGNDELSQLARSFNIMSASIQGFLERERAFTRYASHELRTPLSALKVQVERAELGLVPSAEVLPVLGRNIRRMEEMLGALLALARSSERDPAPTPLLPLIQELLATFPPEARRRVALHDSTIARVKVTDARLVQQALQNLLENAFRYSSGPITLSLDAGNETVTVRLRDTGPGVPEEALSRLTKPFFKVGSYGKGLGLGLALVESIVHALKGTLELQNTEVGLEAILTLPVVTKG